ncbi:hypothetical protein B0H15DRAFT_908044 [Mycena belliarum]|uniref:DUF1275 domain protein n=1 Tax=Mycena belliarum TaxID=1033014 RepID=A0AAD6XPB0_9AGAR|nr:hypothetical protein B0H15DRAFT_908044 [Mycena belliae]
MTYRSEPPSDSGPCTPLLRKAQEVELPSRMSLRQYLWSEVDTDYVTAPLMAFCFMTGFIDAISFTAVFVWCGFQTGNFAQIALAFARMTGGHKFGFTLADGQAVVSLIAFNLGAFIGRIGDRVGPQTRAWLFSGTLVQAIFILIAGICIQQSGQDSVAIGRGVPSWTSELTTVGLALMAASLGLQGIMGKRLNTHFSTTVVLTAMWVELVTDPHLFRMRSKVASRDHKVFALVTMFTGAYAARLLVGQFGAAATLGFGAGLRLVVAAAWLFVRGKGEGYSRLWDDEPSLDAFGSEADAFALPPEVPSYGAVSTA